MPCRASTTSSRAVGGGADRAVSATPHVGALAVVGLATAKLRLALLGLLRHGQRSYRPAWAVTPSPSLPAVNPLCQSRPWVHAIRSSAERVLMIRSIGTLP